MTDRPARCYGEATLGGPEASAALFAPDRDVASVERPLVTVIVPAFNEAGLIEQALRTLVGYLKGLEDRYRWELLVVDDGSTDATPAKVDAFADANPGVRVVHHVVNLKLGQALRTGFAHARGDYVVVLDADLSYAPDHVERLVATLEATKCHVVVASPYMKGGKVTNVPWLRLLLSRWANRFLAYFCHHVDLRTITGMVRGYDRRFLEQLDLKAMGIDINTEIVYKTMLLRGRIVEIPAHLDWTLQRKEGKGRVSSFQILRGILTYTLSGFTFRPFMFFVMPGLLLAAVAVYVVGWICINVLTAYPEMPAGPYFDDQFSAAVAEVFRRRPHAFLVGGVVMVFSLQLLSLGFLSFQAKRYFEELFHLGSSGPRMRPDPLTAREHVSRAAEVASKVPASKPAPRPEVDA